MLTIRWIFRNSGSFHNSYPIILLRICLPLHIQFPQGSFSPFTPTQIHVLNLSSHLTASFPVSSLSRSYISFRHFRTQASSLLQKTCFSQLTTLAPTILFCSCYHNMRLSSTGREPLDTRQAMDHEIKTSWD